jgi:hypothetical protein
MQQVSDGANGAPDTCNIDTDTKETVMKPPALTEKFLLPFYRSMLRYLKSIAADGRSPSGWNFPKLAAFVVVLAMPGSFLFIPVLAWLWGGNSAANALTKLPLRGPRI